LPVSSSVFTPVAAPYHPPAHLQQAPTMDLVSQLLSFPPHPPPPQPIPDVEYDQRIRSLHAILKQAFPQKLVDEMPSGSNLLDVSSSLFPVVRTAFRSSRSTFARLESSKQTWLIDALISGTRSICQFAILPLRPPRIYPRRTSSD
jgi:hypothetical protein